MTGGNIERKRVPVGATLKCMYKNVIGPSYGTFNRVQDPDLSDPVFRFFFRRRFCLSFRWSWNPYQYPHKHNTTDGKKQNC